MAAGQHRFADRRDAGRQLADVLGGMGLADPLVLALPRGGVPVGFEVARVLWAPFDLLIVRKIGAPGHPEYGIGAVVDGSDPQVVLNDEAMGIVRPPTCYVEAEKKRQLAEIERRRETYLGDRPTASTQGRTVIVIDDGIATGGTVRAALKALQGGGAARVVLAVPVAPRDVVEKLRSEADDIVCLNAPRKFEAVGLYYTDFGQTTDHEVIALLSEAQTFEETQARG